MRTLLAVLVLAIGTNLVSGAAGDHHDAAKVVPFLKKWVG